MAPPGNYRYPEVRTPLRRQVHAPYPARKFGLTRRSPSPRQVSGNVLGDFISRNYINFKRNALDLCLCYRADRADREVIDVDDDDEIRDVETISDDDDDVVIEVKEPFLESVNVKNMSFMLDDDDSQANDKRSSLDLNRPITDVKSFEAYRKVLKSAENRTSKLKERGFGDVLIERCRALLRRLCPFLKQDQESVEDVIQREAFLPISKEEETMVKQAFSANNLNVLVTHEDSNIDITVEHLRCLKPGQWLNDEVINLYLVLLKEREAREPKKFLKCHFFNTFFYTKLVNSGSGYNYGAVRRWTSMKKLGYHLIDCDKIFIPIHMNIHWTLAVINVKDRKFQYLDSFKGREPKILDALARYFLDEVKDKCKVDVDINQWRQEFVLDLPEQRNGYDCGMFMLKYIDFYSRGRGLCFTQDQIPYFRVRAAKEILQLKAE